MDALWVGEVFDKMAAVDLANTVVSPRPWLGEVCNDVYTIKLTGVYARKAWGLALATAEVEFNQRG